MEVDHFDASASLALHTVIVEVVLQPARIQQSSAQCSHVDS